MAPGSKSKEKPKTQRKHKEDNVVKLVTRGKVSGRFSQSSFSKLSPLVSVHLEDICEGGLLEAGHMFLGFIKSGRYILSYTNTGHLSFESESESDSGLFYTLYWWEFNLHNKLKLVQQVELFYDEGLRHDFHILSLLVCEWPNDDSHIAVFGFDACSTSKDQLMNSLDDGSWCLVSSGCIGFVTIAPNPPDKPCSHCSATTTRTGSGGRCLEHGYALHGWFSGDCPFPFQPALQLKKDKVILMKADRWLVVCAIYLCPAGEQSQPCQMLYTKRADPPSGQPSSPPAMMLPQGSAEDGHPSTGSPASSSPSSPSPTLSSSSSPSPTLSSSSPSSPSSTLASSSLPSSSSQEADVHVHYDYVAYNRLHYHLPQPGAAGRDFRRCFLRTTDLKGRGQKLHPGGSHGGRSLCVEEMALDVDRLLSVLLHGDAVWDRQDYAYDFVLLEVCPETDTVLIGIALFWKCQERNMQVSWDLGTGRCSVIGVGDLTKEVPYDDCHHGRAVGPHRKSCVDTVMECSVPESSSRRVNIIDVNVDHLPKVVLDDERCTWVTVSAPG